MKSLFYMVLPLTVLAFNGTMISYISGFFSTSNRWILLLMLTVQQIFARHRRHTPPFFMGCLYLYALWCISTTFWSENYELSLMKSSIYFILVFTMVSAGQGWVAGKTLNGSFDYLTPLTIVAYASGILGYFFRPDAFDGMLFQGYAYGANMLGALMAMTIPLMFWRCYLNWNRPRIRNMGICLILLSMLFIFMSMSRASLLMALFSLAGGLISLSSRKQVILVYLIIGIVTLVYSFRPDVSSQVVKRVVYKHADTVTFTRVQVWGDSMEKAKLGGWLGAGYGVAIGAANREIQGFKSVGYGREKGNSQLAIIEETGIFGFILYLLVLVSLFQVLLARYKWTANKDIKVALGLFIGALSGMIAQSFFEAWWVAPGAPESAAFWALVGCAIGVAAMDAGTPPGLNPTPA